MGLFDALRGRSKQADTAADADAAPDDRGPFHPRTGGSYTAGTSTLRFDGDQVVESGADAGDVVRSGEYTAAGRFLLTAPLETSVAFTVLDPGDGDHFVARRTATADRTTAELRYEFVADLSG